MTLPALAGLKGFVLDDKGQRVGAAVIKSSNPGAITVDIKAASKVELAHE